MVRNRVVTQAQLRALLARKGGRSPRAPRVRNAKRTEVDGIPFASQAEARRYEHLRSRAARGECWFIRQPRFDLPGGVQYVGDFLVVELGPDGEPTAVRVEDVKGHETDVFKLKRRQLEALYPFRLEVIPARRA